MSKRRIKFTKLNMAKFISHLDLLRAFTRAVMRAELPVLYSNGFNPHQKMSFALPLSVGVTSECEFVDIDFDDKAENDEIKEKLDMALPPDMKVLSVSVPIVNPNDISAAQYFLEFYDKDFDKEKLNQFFKEDNLPIIKKTKKGEKEVNLKDFIKEFEICELKDKFLKIRLILSAGGSENLKPSLFSDKLISYMGFDENIRVYIHRTEIFYMENNILKSFC